MTQWDHIQNFNRGHLGGVNFDFASLIHIEVRVGGPTNKK